MVWRPVFFWKFKNSFGSVESMKHAMFAVHDAKAKAYLPPFFMHQVAMAVRTFGDAVNDEGHQFCKHPEDYRLYQIGVFDDETGTVETKGSPELIVSANQLVRE